MSRKEIGALRWFQKNLPIIGHFNCMEWSKVLDGLKRYAKIEREDQAERIIHSLSTHGLLQANIYTETSSFSQQTQTQKKLFKGFVTKEGTQFLRKGNIVHSAVIYVLIGAVGVAIISVLTDRTDLISGLLIGGGGGFIIKLGTVIEEFILSKRIVD